MIKEESSLTNGKNNLKFSELKISGAFTESKLKNTYFNGKIYLNDQTSFIGDMKDEHGDSTIRGKFDLSNQIIVFIKLYNKQEQPGCFVYLLYCPELEQSIQQNKYQGIFYEMREKNPNCGLALMDCKLQMESLIAATRIKNKILEFSGKCPKRFLLLLKERHLLLKKAEDKMSEDNFFSVLLETALAIKTQKISYPDIFDTSHL